MPRVVLVDDQQRNVLALQAVLAQPRRELVSALCGPDALAAVEKREFSAACSTS
jgi:CheY-like chemotaxis protein